MPTSKQHLQLLRDLGAETEFQEGYAGDSWAKARDVFMHLTDKKGTKRLWHISGFKKYSRKCTYYKAESWLSGYEDKQLWAIRIPGHIKTISEAVQWVKPAKVKNAENSGKKVVRQGDIFFIESERKCKFSLPFNHRYIESLSTVVHPEHGATKLPFKNFTTAVAKSVVGQVAD